MSTHTQSAHWAYTLAEFQHPAHQRILDRVFSDQEIRVVYDIGANTGATAHLFLQRQPLAHIVCFEPDDDNVQFMRQALSAEIASGKVIVVPKGVFYGRTSARVHITTILDESGAENPYFNVGGWSIDECAQERCKLRQRGGERVGTQPVADKVFLLGSVEELAAQLPPPDFVKIDVEGAERNILQHSTLLRRAKYIWVEWNQEEAVADFVKEHLPEFEIVDSGADVLLKRMCATPQSPL